MAALGIIKSHKRPAPSGKLKIGVSTCFFHADPTRPVFKGKTLIYAEQSITHWVMSQDALVMLVPPPIDGGSVTIKDLVAELDGLVLEGGSDVAPETYGETALKPEWKGDRVRDLYEQALLREFVAQGKPVLGVCRGAQLINVAYGGTLHQDIETQVPKALNHRNWDIYDQNFHEVEFTPGKALAELYPGVKKGKVNTIHHQALKDLGKDLKVEAVSPQDGMIEAVRLESATDWVFAVQWHPEFHDPKDSTLLDSRPILTDFLREVRARRDR
jgi:putative glutamine amidotransferase